jgi:hypothetical protein
VLTRRPGAHECVHAFLERVATDPAERERIARTLRPLGTVRGAGRPVVGCEAGSGEAPGAWRGPSDSSPTGPSKVESVRSLGSSVFAAFGGSIPRRQLEVTPVPLR